MGIDEQLEREPIENDELMLHIYHQFQLLLGQKAAPFFINIDFILLKMLLTLTRYIHNIKILEA